MHSLFRALICLSQISRVSIGFVSRYSSTEPLDALLVGPSTNGLVDQAYFLGLGFPSFLAPFYASFFGAMLPLEGKRYYLKDQESKT